RRRSSRVIRRAHPPMELILDPPYAPSLVRSSRCLEGRRSVDVDDVEQLPRPRVHFALEPRNEDEVILFDAVGLLSSRTIPPNDEGPSSIGQRSFGRPKPPPAAGILLQPNRAPISSRP